MAESGPDSTPSKQGTTSEKSPSKSSSGEAEKRSPSSQASSPRNATPGSSSSANGGWQGKQPPPGRGQPSPHGMYMQHPPMPPYMMNQPPLHRGYGPGPGYSMPPPGSMYGPPPPGYYPHPYPMQQPYPVQQMTKSKGKQSSPTKSSGVHVGVASKDGSETGKEQGKGKEKFGHLEQQKLTSSHKPPDHSPTSDDRANKEEDDKMDEDEPLVTSPMRHDFHFYVDDNADAAIEEARQQLKRLLSLRDNNDDKVDPILLFTNVNERLMSRWEIESEDTREIYRQKEDADRVRFMHEDEVASRHCATLTARAEKKAAGLGTPEKSSPEKSSPEKESPDKDGTEKSRTAPVNAEIETLAKASQMLEQASKDDQAAQIAKKSNARSPSPQSPSSESGSPSKKLKESPKDESPAKETTTTEDKTANGAKEQRGDSGDVSEDGDVGSEDQSNASHAYVVEKLLDRRIRKVRDRKVKEYLVRWKGRGEDADTWEPFKNVSHMKDDVRIIDEEKDKEGHGEQFSV